MPGIVHIAIALAFLLECVTSQAVPSTQCQNALSQQPTACATAVGTDICSGDCRDAFQAVFDNCAPQVSLIVLAI